MRPVCGRVAGKLGAEAPRICSNGAMKQMLVQGDNLGLLDEAWELGHQQRPGPENQDSQHTLNQPRRLFLIEFVQEHLLFLLREHFLFSESGWFPGL